MKAEFDGTYLKIGDEAKISLDGEYVARVKSGWYVGNLINCLIEFADGLLDSSRLKYSQLYICGKQLIKSTYFLNLAYQVNVAIPCNLMFELLGGKVSGWVNVKDETTVKGYLKIEDAVYYEETTGNVERVIRKMVEIGRRRKIYYPIYMLRPIARRGILSFQASDGEVVFEINERDYKLNYMVFGGKMQENYQPIFKWLEYVILKNFGGDLEWFEVRDDVLVARSGGVEISYDVSEKELIDFKFSVEDLTVKLIDDGIKMVGGDKSRVELYVVSMRAKRGFKKRIGRRLWDVFKYLVF